MTENQLMKTVEAYFAAYGAQDQDGCARTFTPDGALFSPYGPAARGRAAIAATHLEWFAEDEQDKRFELLEFHGNGVCGHCVLGWSARVPDENGPSGFRRVGGVSLAVLAVADDEVLFDRLALVPDPE